MQKLPIWRHFHTTACKFKEIPKKSKSHSSQLWLTRQLSDPFVEMAKTQNYRCRSAFKLLEIDDKTHILAAGHTVIDCGGAPGSWTQVAVTRSNADGKIKNKPKGFVIGIDLLNIYPIEGAHVLGNSNFTLPETQEKVKKLLDGRKINCVLSDMAPNATGIRCLDQEIITKLCYSVLRFALLMSAPHASLLVKVWDNANVPQLEKDMLRFYKSVKHIKPPASRTDSSEKFLLARDFIGLKTPETPSSL